MTSRALKKGDIVYVNVHHAGNSWNYCRPYTVTKVRKANYADCVDDRATVWLHGKSTGQLAWSLTHHDDLTPEQAAEVARVSAERTRAEAEDKDSRNRLNARNKATKDANRDKLDAPPVYGPVMLGDGKWRRVSEDCKPIGSTFTYWTATEDKHGVVGIVQRTDWIGVEVRRDHNGGRYSWGISFGGTTYSQTDARIMAEAIRIALDEVIPTLGDPRPDYDREG